MNRKIAALAALLLVVSASGAWALGKGSSMFAIQLTHGMADFAGPGDGGYINAFNHSEMGAQGQLWHMMSADYAVAISAGYGFFNETDTPGDTATTTKKFDQKYSQKSFNMRIGGDRVVKIGDRALIYFGPGVEFWSGRAKFENFGFTGRPGAVETETTKRFSFSGRRCAILSWKLKRLQPLWSDGVARHPSHTDERSRRWAVSFVEYASASGGWARSRCCGARSTRDSS